MGRIDSILPLRPSIGFVALMGQPRAPARFLPHDTLLLSGIRRGQHDRTLALPEYVTPPGLASTPDARAAFVVVDTALLAVDPGSGTIQKRWRLDLHALGWPAAVVGDEIGHLYVVGQQWDNAVPAAEVEALEVSRSPRVLWRSPLGVTHAGIWLGLTGLRAGRRGAHLLAAYLPDAHDVSGSVALLDEGSGTLYRAFFVPGPPVAIDPVHDLLYVPLGGTIRVLASSRGTPVATVSGSQPLAVDPARGLVAFVQHGRVVLAAARTLRRLASIPLSGATALAFSPDGSTLLAGIHSGVAYVNLGRCRAP